MSMLTGMYQFADGVPGGNAGDFFLEISRRILERNFVKYMAFAIVIHVFRRKFYVRSTEYIESCNIKDFFHLVPTLYELQITCM